MELPIFVKIKAQDTFCVLWKRQQKQQEQQQQNSLVVQMYVLIYESSFGRVNMEVNVRIKCLYTQMQNMRANV